SGSPVQLLVMVLPPAGFPGELSAPALSHALADATSSVSPDHSSIRRYGIIQKPPRAVSKQAACRSRTRVTLLLPSAAPGTRVVERRRPATPAARQLPARACFCSGTVVANSRLCE